MLFDLGLSCVILDFSQTTITQKIREGKVEGPTQEEVDRLVWWHPFTFPNGVKVRTQGLKGGAQSEEALRLESEAAFKYFSGEKTVLDIGAWNGYFCVEAFRRGASRVVALDKPDTWEVRSKSLDLVRRYLAPDLESVKADVMDLRHNPIGKFDCVLFLGVLYHLKHPLFVLETLFDLTLEHLVVETHIDFVDYSRPAMVFYPGNELNGDYSNWWGPNPKCVADMLRTVGFARVEFVKHPLVANRAFFYAFK